MISSNNKNTRASLHTHILPKHNLTTLVDFPNEIQGLGGSFQALSRS